MSSFKKESRERIKKRVHILEQKDILVNNLLNISLTSINILKNTIFSDYDIQINGLTKTLCNFFKFLSLNMCGVTELSPILTAFFSFLANLVIPKKVNPIKLNEIKDLYDNQLREESIQDELGEYEPLDKQSVVNLRKNLIMFMDKLVETFPETSREVYPLCDISKYITVAVCNYARIFIPFLIFIRLLTHTVIPDEVITAIVEALSRPRRINYGVDEYEQQMVNNYNKSQTVEANINESAPSYEQGQPMYYQQPEQGQAMYYQQPEQGQAMYYYQQPEQGQPMYYYQQPEQGQPMYYQQTEQGQPMYYAGKIKKNSKKGKLIYRSRK
jgi:hypothetical protein